MIAPKVGRAPAPNAGAAAADPPSGDGAAPNPPPAGAAPMGLRAPPAGAAPKLPDVAGAGEGWHGAVFPVPAAAAPPKTGAELTTMGSKRPPPVAGAAGANGLAGRSRPQATSPPPTNRLPPDAGAGAAAPPPNRPPVRATAGGATGAAPGANGLSGAPRPATAPNGSGGGVPSSRRTALRATREWVPTPGTLTSTLPSACSIATVQPRKLP